MKKAQTSIVMILLVIMIFGGLGIFLLSLVQTVTQEDYMNIYTHNMLISLLRTDTDEAGEECRQVSDVIICAAYGGMCDSGTRCSTLAELLVGNYMDALSQVKATYDWYIVMQDSDGFELLDFGDSTLLNKKTKKWSASEVLYESIGFRENTYNVRLILGRSED